MTRRVRLLESIRSAILVLTYIYFGRASKGEGEVEEKYKRIKKGCIALPIR